MTSPTTPHDDIGLSDRLRRTTEMMACRCSVPMDLWQDHSTAALESATQLDALLKERDALQARVKELEDGRNFWKSERDRIKAFLSEGDWQTVESEQAWRNRATRAEQERDEAYERAAKVADDTELISYDPGECRAFIAAAIRRLAAGPEKGEK